MGAGELHLPHHGGVEGHDPADRHHGLGCLAQRLARLPALLGGAAPVLD